MVNKNNFKVICFLLSNNLQLKHSEIFILQIFHYFKLASSVFKLIFYFKQKLHELRGPGLNPKRFMQFINSNLIIYGLEPVTL